MVNKSKIHFLKTYKKSSLRWKSFPHHVDIVVRWVERLCDLHPEANREIALIGAWFHDIGHFVGNEKDHAVSSEKEALCFLKKKKVSEDKIKKILHIVRSHRNRDVKPETIEAKIVCCADSASHITADVYLSVLADGADRKDYIMGKLDRDYRDISVFPEVKKELAPLYKAWKKVIESFPNDFVEFLPKTN